MIATANVAIRLESILGAGRIAATDEQLREYAIDDVVPSAIVLPKSDAEVMEIVRFAASEGLSVIASGSRSKLEIGMPPTHYDIAIDMREMCGIAHFDAGDLTLSTEAGMSLVSLEKILAEKHQFLPIAVPCYQRSTIGGAVASGIDSVLRRQYGTVRDFLIGGEFVDGKGTLCKSGGRVVKNVTGYDLHKLLVGSLGTLAVITRLNFRTFPLPRAFGGFTATFADVGGALAFRAAVERKGLPIANIELLDAEARRLARFQMNILNSAVGISERGEQYLAYISFEGNEMVVQRTARELEMLARDGNALESGEMDSSADAAMGRVMREVFDRLRCCAPVVALFHITFSALQAAHFKTLQEIASAASLGSALFIRGGGVVYFGLFAEQENPGSIEIVSKAAESVFSAVGGVKGCATLLHAPTMLKQRINVWGAKRGDFAMMQRVKNAFDPANILAPGRFVGGL
jgi:glycolate oxidase FAD binding subunit